MNTPTERGNMALRSLIELVRRADSPDAWDIAYHRGQISIIENYLEPDAELLAEAKREVDRMKRREVGHG